MGKIVVFQVTSSDVKGDFEAEDGDFVLLLATSAPAGDVHAVRDGVDACNLLGSPCPMDLMTAYSIPPNEYGAGTYSIEVKTSAAAEGPPTISNGTLNVGSGPSDPPGRRRRRRG